MMVAEICLYGNGPRGCGSGWLATLENGAMFGTGQPVAGASFTDAVFAACADLTDALRGTLDPNPAKPYTVRVFAPRGDAYADTALWSPKTFGALSWQPAGPAVVITLDVA